MRLYKFVDDKATSIFVVADNYEKARNRVIGTIGHDKIKFKYCRTDESKIRAITKALAERRKRWQLDTELIILP